MLVNYKKNTISNLFKWYCFYSPFMLKSFYFVSMEWYITKLKKYPLVDQWL